MEPRVSRAAAELEVPAAHAGRRLDKFLRAHLKGVPAGLIFRHLRKGGIRVNGRKVEGGYRIEAGDLITLPAFEVQDTSTPPPPRALREQLAAAIVHEDERLLVLNKPAGVPVHVGTGHRGGVIEALRADRPQDPDLELAHRLDRDTSGLLILSKTPAMLRHLSGMLAAGTGLRRHYTALVRGFWPEDLSEVSVPIARTESGMVASARGDKALTRAEVRRRLGREATLLDLELITGRRHQIRVHTSHAGHPVAGDEKYGDPAFNRRVGGGRFFLHAAALEIPLPEGEMLHLSAPQPAEWQDTLDQLAGSPGRSGPPPRRRPQQRGGTPRRQQQRRPRR